MQERTNIKTVSGQTMIESLVAVSMVIVGILGIVSLLVSSEHQSASVTNRLTAAYLAAENIEVVKNILDTEYLQGSSFASAFTPGDLYTLNYDSTSPQLMDAAQSNMSVYYNASSTTYVQPPDPVDGDTLTVFKRYIYIAPSTNPAVLDVQAVVIWDQNGVSQKFYLEDKFTNWRGQAQ